MPPLVLKKKEKSVEIDSMKLAYLIESPDGKKVLSIPKGEWVEKENLLKEENYASLNEVIVPSLLECEESLAWLERSTKEEFCKKAIFKYVKVTFEIIGEVSE